MSRYIGCETARELLDEFLDDELSVDDQVMVESHLRWCRTCTSRVEDMRLIGSSLRDGSPFLQVVDTDLESVSIVQEGVLLRVRAEHELSLASRVQDLFSDMRLWWPALGATTALAICVMGTFLVLRWSSEERPESLAAMITTLSQPGSEGNPLLPYDGVRSLYEDIEENRLSGGISIPRSLDDGGRFEDVQRAVDLHYAGSDADAGGDAVAALSTVVTRDGRIVNYEVLSEPRGADAALANAVRHSRFAPAQTPGGNKVAVNMIWLIYTTKAVMPPPDAIVRASAERPASVPVAAPAPAPQPERPAAPAETTEAPERRSSVPQTSAAA